MQPGDEQVDVAFARAAVELGLLTTQEANDALGQAGPGGLDGFLRAQGRLRAEDALAVRERMRGAGAAEELRVSDWTLASDVLREAGDPEKLVDLSLALLVRETGAERGFLMLLDDERQPIFVAARNFDADQVGEPGLKVSRSIVQEVASSGRPILLADAGQDPRYQAARSVHYLELTSVLAVPLRGDEGVAGVVYLENRFRAGRFGEAALRRVQAFVGLVAGPLMASLALRHARARAHELEDLYRRALARGAAARHGLVGSSAALERVCDLIDRAAPTDVSVLIHGESGAGKELVARALHTAGPRRVGPYVVVNCAATAENLLESELFGHRRGAFSGALADRKGLFALADQGTLFLDEVGDMPAAMQVKLLRALQDGEFTPLGGEAVERSDARVVAATHKDLAREVSQGRFRKDLYFRLVGLVIEVPPLRERLEDIPQLVAYFQAGTAAEALMTGGALRRLMDHRWPGNVRELKNVMDRARILAGAGQKIQAGHIVIDAAAPARQTSAVGAGTYPLQGNLKELVEAYERDVVRAALEAAGGEMTQAAALLGVSRRVLYNITDRLEIRRRRRR